MQFELERASSLRRLALYFNIERAFLLTNQRVLTFKLWFGRTGHNFHNALLLRRRIRFWCPNNFGPRIRLRNFCSRDFVGRLRRTGSVVGRSRFRLRNFGGDYVGGSADSWRPWWYLRSGRVGVRWTRRCNFDPAVFFSGRTNVSFRAMPFSISESLCCRLKCC